MDTKNLEARTNNRGAISYWKDGVLIGRKCTKCNKDKEIKEFRLQNKNKGTYRAECKDCEKQYKEANKEHTKEYHRQRYENNKERYKENNKRWEENNKEHRKEQRRQYRENNIKKIREREKKAREKFKEYYEEYRKQYAEEKRNENIVEITNMLHQINPVLKELGIKAYGYVYEIINIKTGRRYIGQSTTSLEKRYRNKGVIKGWINDRRDKVNQKFLEELQGEENFIFAIIDYGICQYHLDKIEAHWINKYDSCNNGYNNYAGNHKSTVGLEEFQQILKEHNLEYKDNKLIQIKNTHHNG